MSYSEPKVTIDLKEYNELLDYKRRFNKLNVADYQIGLTCMINLITSQNMVPTSLMATLTRSLKNNGLQLSTSGHTNETSSIEKVFIEKIKQ